MIERIGGFGGKSDVLAQNEVYGGDRGVLQDPARDERQRRRTPDMVRVIRGRVAESDGRVRTWKSTPTTEGPGHRHRRRTGHGCRSLESPLPGRTSRTIERAYAVQRTSKSYLPVGTPCPW